MPHTQPTPRTVLVIERAPSTATIFQHITTRQTILQQASSVEEARPLLSRWPDLILCDLNLSGAETLYRDASPELRDRFMFLTTSSCSEDKRRLLEQIGKPEVLYQPISPLMLQILLNSPTPIPIPA